MQDLLHAIKLVKLEQSHYRPWQALRVPGVWGSHISRQTSHEGGKVVSPTHRPPLPPGNIPGTHFWGWVDPRAIVRPEGLCQWKIPMALSGIEPAKLRLAYNKNLQKNAKLCNIVTATSLLNERWVHRASWCLRRQPTIFAATNIKHNVNILVHM
jgi:hypothetical protein